METIIEPPPLPPGPPAPHWYSPKRLWSKLARCALKAGRKCVLTALALFYCLQDKETPAWAKGIIMGALGYLILPMDAIPDAIPVVGFSDDWAALVAALGTVTAYIKDEHKQKATERAAKLMGPA
jgi:uncharacterized membrane protein YkvA (DUF1232 family)